MSKPKMLLIAALYAVVMFLVPLVLLLLFISVDDMQIYFVVLGFFFFFSLGLVVALTLSQKKELNAAIEELRIQNAAIAFRLNELKGGKFEEEKQPVSPDSFAGSDSPKKVKQKMDPNGGAASGIPISKKKPEDTSKNP